MVSLLVVDDDDLFRAFLTEWLEGRGYKVTACGGAQEALECMLRQRYAAVLTDILMPDMDGIELLMTLRARQPGIPVIALTGGGQHRAIGLYLSSAAHLGASAVMGKPVDLKELEQVLSRFIPDDVG